VVRFSYVSQYYGFVVCNLKNWAFLRYGAVMRFVVKVYNADSQSLKVLLFDIIHGSD